MKCPICCIALQMSERNGIEIDYCPKCRGVWLVRGEIDKMLEKSELPAVSNVERNEARYRGPVNQYKHKKRRWKSFLEEIFD